MSQTVSITLGSNDARTIAAALLCYRAQLTEWQEQGLRLPTSPEHVNELHATFSSVPRDGIHIKP